MTEEEIKEQIEELKTELNELKKLVEKHRHDGHGYTVE